MAETMQFDLVSPERMLASVQASEVRIPGADGDMTAMPDHASVITTLRPGILRIAGAEGTLEFAVTGGFAEITPKATSVLAERAFPVAEMTQEILDQIATEAADARDNASADMFDVLTKEVHDISVLAAELGLTVKTG
ncbi:MAG: F0F1 ATP synthase subunit epsilon [Halocynthiibacter sp.]